MKTGENCEIWYIKKNSMNLKYSVYRLLRFWNDAEGHESVVLYNV